MKSGRRKDWEALLNPEDEKNLPWEDQQVIEEWMKEWEEFDKIIFGGGLFYED